MAEDTTREFVDRALRERLERPENLAELLADTVPEVAAHLDFTQMRPAPREFIVGNFRERESDLLFEIPYRTPNQQTTTLVCVLVEHQTRSDWLIPLKTFIYAALYWEWQWHKWETKNKDKDEKEPFALTPVLPIVLFTGPRPWGSARKFRELFAMPKGMEEYVPNWQPIFWELARHTAQQLLNHPSVFLKTLTVLKANDSDYIEATQVYQDVFERVDSIHDQQQSRWSEAMQFLVGWSTNKRPTEERSQWNSFTLELQHDAARRREIERMSKTIAQGYIEEGMVEGELRHARAMLIRFTQRRLNAPDEETRNAINAITDLNRLERMTDQYATVATWADLLAIQ